MGLFKRLLSDDPRWRERFGVVDSDPAFPPETDLAPALSRRGFLKGAAAAPIVVAAGPLLPSTPPETPEVPETPARPPVYEYRPGMFTTSSVDRLVLSTATSGTVIVGQR